MWSLVLMVLGFGIGLVGSKYPQVKLIGWLVTSVAGYEALISYWVVVTVIGMAQRWAGGLDEYGLAYVNVAEPHESTSLKESSLDAPNYVEGMTGLPQWIGLVMAYILGGCFIGCLLAGLGFRGLGGAYTWVFVCICYLTLYGLDRAVGGLMLGLVIGIQVLAMFGVSQGPVIFISLLSGLGLLNPQQLEVSMPRAVRYWAQLEGDNELAWTLEHDWLDLRALGIGVVGGIVPGINAEALGGSQVQTGWLGGVVAEAVSLTVLLVQRNTSKTTLTTYLSMYGTHEIDLSIGVGCLVGSLVLLALGSGFIAWALEQELVKGWLADALVIGSLAGWIQVPDQPLVSLVIGGVLYWGSKLLKSLMDEYIDLPIGIERSLSMAPLMLSK